LAITQLVFLYCEYYEKKLSVVLSYREEDILAGETDRQTDSAGAWLRLLATKQHPVMCVCLCGQSAAAAAAACIAAEAAARRADEYHARECERMRDATSERATSVIAVITRWWRSWPQSGRWTTRHQIVIAGHHNTLCSSWLRSVARTAIANELFS